VSRTPAAAIARIKATHPAWSVREVRSGRGWTAKHRETRAVVYADSPEALAVTLAEIDRAPHNPGRIG
jgi:hypothetical protein